MCPIVSANWNNGSNAGVWALNLNNVRSNTNNNVGGRADSESPRTPQGDGGAKGDAFRRVGMAERHAWRQNRRASVILVGRATRASKA